MILRAATIALLTATQALAADRSFPVTAFDQISLAGASGVTVATGKAIGVRASGDADALDRLDIRVEDNVLIIGTKKGDRSWNRGKVDVAVTVPTLRAAAVAGSGRMTVDRIDVPEFSANVAGSGELALPSLTAPSTRFAVAGSGKLTAAGTSRETKANVTGSGDLAIPQLKTVALNASVAGSGNLDAFASGTAKVSVAGSGGVRVRGGARCTVAKAGSGSVDCA